MKRMILSAVIAAVCLMSGCTNIEDQPVTSSDGKFSYSFPELSAATDKSEPESLPEAEEKPDRIVLVGDSRIMQLGHYLYEMAYTDDGTLVDEETPDGDYIIGAGAQGYAWLAEHTEDIEDKLTDGCALVVNMGVNGVPYFHEEIASWCNDIAEKYRDRGVKVYFLSVTPVNDRLLKSYNYAIRNVDVVCFNSEIRMELEDVTYLDAYSVVTEDIFGDGDGTYDGLHYYESVYRKIRDFTWNTIKG